MSKNIEQLKREVSNKDVVWSFDDFCTYMIHMKYHFEYKEDNIYNISNQCKLLHLPMGIAICGYQQNDSELFALFSDKPDKDTVIIFSESVSTVLKLCNTDDCEYTELKSIYFQGSSVRFNAFTAHCGLDWLYIRNFADIPKYKIIRGLYNNCKINNAKSCINEVTFYECFNKMQDSKLSLGWASACDSFFDCKGCSIEFKVSGSMDANNLANCCKHTNIAITCIDSDTEDIPEFCLKDSFNDLDNCNIQFSRELKSIDNSFNNCTDLRINNKSVHASIKIDNILHMCGNLFKNSGLKVLNIGVTETSWINWNEGHTEIGDIGDSDTLYNIYIHGNSLDSELFYDITRSQCNRLTIQATDEPIIFLTSNNSIKYPGDCRDLKLPQTITDIVGLQYAFGKFVTSMVFSRASVLDSRIFPCIHDFSTGFFRLNSNCRLLILGKNVEKIDEEVFRYASYSCTDIILDGKINSLIKSIPTFPSRNIYIVGRRDEFNIDSQQLKFHRVYYVDSIEQAEDMVNIKYKAPNKVIKVLTGGAEEELYTKYKNASMKLYKLFLLHKRLEKANYTTAQQQEKIFNTFYNMLYNNLPNNNSNSKDCLRKTQYGFRNRTIVYTDNKEIMLKEDGDIKKIATLHEHKYNIIESLIDRLISKKYIGIPISYSLSHGDIITIIGNSDEHYNTKLLSEVEPVVVLNNDNLQYLNTIGDMMLNMSRGIVLVYGIWTEDVKHLYQLCYEVETAKFIEVISEYRNMADIDINMFTASIVHMYTLDEARSIDTPFAIELSSML